MVRSAADCDLHPFQRTRTRRKKGVTFDPAVGTTERVPMLSHELIRSSYETDDMDTSVSAC